MITALGQIAVTSGRILAIDPCYPPLGASEIVRLGVTVDVPNGTYNVVSETGNPYITITIGDNPVARYGVAGDVSVDSGQVFFLDPALLSEYGAGPFTSFSGIGRYTPELPSYTFDYDGACMRSGTQVGGGQIGENGEAVVSRTAYGDGGYNVYVGYDTDGAVMTVTAVFAGMLCEDCWEAIEDEDGVPQSLDCEHGRADFAEHLVEEDARFARFEAAQQAERDAIRALCDELAAERLARANEKVDDGHGTGTVHLEAINDKEHMA